MSSGEQCPRCGTMMIHKPVLYPNRPKESAEVVGLRREIAALKAMADGAGEKVLAAVKRADAAERKVEALLAERDEHFREIHDLRQKLVMSESAAKG